MALKSKVYSSSAYYNGGDWHTGFQRSFRPGLISHPKIPRDFAKIQEISPTAEIVKQAFMNPGGIITWAEAVEIYLETVESVRKRRVVNGQVQYARRRDRHFHMNISHIFRNYFHKILDSDGKPVRGYYMLNPFLRDYMRGYL